MIHQPFEALASSIYSALNIDLDPIHYLGNRYTKTGIVADKPCVRRPTLFDIISIDLFQMQFGHGSGLFGGIGAANCPTYHIVVVQSKTRETCVYQEGSLVYKIKNPNQLFYEDLAKRHLKGRSSYKTYEKED